MQYSIFGKVFFFLNLGSVYVINIISETQEHTLSLRMKVEQIPGAKSGESGGVSLCNTVTWENKLSVWGDDAVAAMGFRVSGIVQTTKNRLRVWKKENVSEEK